MTLIPIRRQRQVNLCEFQKSLVYIRELQESPGSPEKPRLKAKTKIAHDSERRVWAGPAGSRDKVGNTGAVPGSVPAAPHLACCAHSAGSSLSRCCCFSYFSVLRNKSRACVDLASVPHNRSLFCCCWLLRWLTCYPALAGLAPCLHLQNSGIRVGALMPSLVP